MSGAIRRAYGVHTRILNALQKILVSINNRLTYLGMEDVRDISSEPRWRIFRIACRGGCLPLCGL